MDDSGRRSAGGTTPLLHVAFAVTGVLVALAQTIVWSFIVTIVLTVPGLWLAGVLGTFERRRIATIGTDVREPMRRARPSFWQWLTDPVLWRAAGYATVQSVWALFAGTIVLALGISAVVLGWVSLTGSSSGGISVLGMDPRQGSGRVVAGVLAAAFVGLTLVTARGANAVTVTFARWLLGPDPDAELRILSARVDAAETAREGAVDSVEAERRRIERDLHDGPQQRLVAIAMDLGMARSAMESDPARAREILDKAHADSKSAIIEMRQIARGIAPPILTDRGLDAALLSLAGRAPVPVSVDVRLPAGAAGRFDPSIEAIAYFCVSEALTNVAKHASATRAAVLVEERSGALQLTVSDDGVGGAAVPQRAGIPADRVGTAMGVEVAVEAGGTGLVGLRQRVAAVDGTLTLQSPIGGPTVVSIWLPARQRRTT